MAADSKPLNFPRSYAFEVRELAEQREIFDTIRRRWVALTPEEWVRQHMVRYLTEDLEYPPGRTGVEIGFEWRRETYRADIVVHTKSGTPLIAVECKAPDVRVNQRAFDQIGHYNQALGARFLVVTNGHLHFCVEIVEDRPQPVQTIPYNPER